MNKSRVIQEYKNILKKLADFSVEQGRFPNVESNWTLNDLREIISLLDSNHESGHNINFLSKVQSVMDRYTGKGEKLSGHLAHGVISQLDLINFNNAQYYLRNHLARKNKQEEFPKGYLDKSGRWVDGEDWI